MKLISSLFAEKRSFGVPQLTYNLIRFPVLMVQVIGLSASKSETVQGPQSAIFKELMGMTINTGRDSKILYFLYGMLKHTFNTFVGGKMLGPTF